MFKAISSALAATLVAGLFTSTAYAGAGHCATGGKRSIHGDVPTRVRFKVVGENDETQAKIYWIDYNGRPKFYKHLFAGQSYTQQTYMTHPWLITYPAPGGGEDCGRVYMPRRSMRTVVIR